MAVISVPFSSMSAAHRAAPTFRELAVSHLPLLQTRSVFENDLPVLVKAKIIEANGIISSTVATVPNL